MRRGVTRSTLDEIAKEAGVTRGAVYWHFENKNAIFKAMHDRVKLPMDTLFLELTSGPDPLAGLKAMCVHVFRTLETDLHARNVFTIMRLRCEDSYCEEGGYTQQLDAKYKEVQQKFMRVFEHIAQQHPLATGVTPEFAAIAMHSFVSGVFWDYLNRPGAYPIGAMGPQLVETFFRGIIR